MCGVGVGRQQTALGYLQGQLDLLCWGGGRLGGLTPVLLGLPRPSFGVFPAQPLSNLWERERAGNIKTERGS